MWSFPRLAGSGTQRASFDVELVDGFAFLRKSHGGCNMPPACCQEPPFESERRRLRLNGAGGRIRTPDLLITNQLLYQLSYTSIFNQRT